jgi:DNA-binding FadR family transcriptional regulator
MAKSRADLVMEHVKNLIVSGSLSPGAKLPTETEIAKAVGVSRTPVREGLKILAAANVIDIRHGYGTFVKEKGEASDPQLVLFARYLEGATPQKLMEIRQVFERSCAELAAARRGVADLRAITRTIDAMRDVVERGDDDIDGALKADLAFHKAIYAAADNELIETLANFVLHQVAPWIRKSLETSKPSRALQLHEELFALIEAGDATSVRDSEAIKANMEHFRAVLEDPGQFAQD